MTSLKKHLKAEINPRQRDLPYGIPEAGALLESSLIVLNETMIDTDCVQLGETEVHKSIEITHSTRRS